MSKSELTGTRIRARRNLRGLRQSELAQLVGVSPSYMNLIEHNRRKVSAPLLAALARVLDVEEAALVEDGDARLGETIRAGMVQEAAEFPDLEKLDDFTSRFPGWAHVLAQTQARVAQLERVVKQLNDRMTHDPYLGEALHEIISAVTSVQSTAAILNDDQSIEPEWQARFHHNILQDSTRLAEGAVALVNYIDAAGDTETGLAAPQEEVEAWLARRGYHVPEIETENSAPDMSQLIQSQPELASEASRILALAHLHRMRADATALPLGRMLAWLDELGLAPDAIARQSGGALDQVLRRLAMLPPDALDMRGLSTPGLVICDASGTLTLRRPVDGFPLPRFGGGCPLWPLYSALQVPGRAIRASVLTDGRLGRWFTTYAVSHVASAPSFTAAPVMLATMLIVPEPGPLPGEDGTRNVGGSCRTCAHEDCPARREPSIMSGATAQLRA